MNLPLRNSRIKLKLGQLFWREVGQGRVLVFIHGSWNDGSQWLPVIESLSQDYHCLAPDLLGFGESQKPKLHHSIQLQVECLAEYLEALHLSQVYLIGHSLGGWIAASYALKYPEQVCGMVLLAPEGVQVEGQRGRWRGARGLVGRFPIVYGILRSLFPLARLFGWHKGIEQTLRQRQRLKSSPTACQLLFQRRRSEIQAELLEEKLDWLKVPTLILQGGRDTTDAIARSQSYQAKLPQAHLQMIDHATQDLPEVFPSLVAQHIDEFVTHRSSLGVKDDRSHYL